MTDAEKRERVIRGLESHIDPERPCRGCPYNGEDYCLAELQSDTLALLKEQEARVMSVEEIAERAACLDPDPIYVQWKTGAAAWIASAIDIIAGAAKAGNYNFRAWTSRPTPDQMQETKWDAD